MQLQLASGKVVEDATEDDIRSLIDGERFAVLADSLDTYIQCAESDPPQDYVLEYQDGCSRDRHFEALDHPIPLERVMSGFISYLHGDDAWRSAFLWEKLDLS